ncbi:calcium-activated chloride channel regulator 2-like [Rhipicephalus microplus]|uniref:calcium-activated chloride channel regulator 2-like n=1 Tax=Rhipicephalus microplus TaxID=6941 RepID=UPI003F6BC76B
MDLSERCLGCHRKRFLGPPFMVVLWLFLRWSSNSGAAAIRLQDDGGYVDLVVAVHEALPVELELVEQLKTVLSRSSAFLHRATQGLVQFRDVTIALPPHWPPAEHGDTLASVRANAPIRIVSNEEAQWPRTVQPRSCGQPGEYTLLPADALRNAQADYLVVHEWAHLRFGVFDEFGFPKDPLYPAVYTRGKQVLSNTCSARIVTSQQKEDGAPCGIIEGTLETSGCLDFEPVPELTDARSSIMFLPPLPTVDSFCNDSADFAHNADAPSPQNALCDGRSTWSVISATDDMRRLSGPLPLQATNFRVVRSGSGPGRLVLVMDISASMAEGDRLAQLRRSVGRFLEDGVPDNSLELSMVVFNQKARVVEPPTMLNATVRRRLKETALPVSVGGRTSMGAGIVAAVEVLQSGGAEGSAMLLITDGAENEPPFISQVLPLLLQKKIMLYALAVTTDAEDSLDKAARDTGGRAFTTAGSEDVVTCIADVIASAAIEQLEEGTRPVTLFSEFVNATSFDVPLDEELGRSTQFVSSSQHLEVVSPSGERLLGSYKASLQRSKLVIDSAWAGQWTVRLSEPARVSITSRPSRSGPLAKLRAFLGNGVLERAAVHVPPAVLHAELMRGARPLHGAQVMASVRTPRGVEVRIPLRDDGAGTDVTAGDGVYSAAFITLDVAGRYAVQVRARGRRGAGNGSFFRFSDAGSLWVGAIDGHLAYPPSMVRDLSVEGVSRTGHGWLITLAWTAPGDQVDQGTGAKVELFVANMASALRNLSSGSHSNTTSVHRVTESQLVGSSRMNSVPPAGHLHRVSLITQTSSPALFFAVVAVSHSGLRSALSNIAVANVVSSMKSRQAPFPSWLPVLLFSLLTVAAVLILAAAYLRIRRREVLRSDRPVVVFAASPGKAQVEMACRKSLLP